MRFGAVRLTLLRIPLSFALLAALAVACGSSPPPPAPPPRAPAPRAFPAGFAQITEKCAKISSCAHPHDPPRVRDPAACVDAWLLRAPDARADKTKLCLLKASTCADIEACEHGGGDAAATAYCRGHVGAMSGCDGARLVTCAADDAAEATVVDCSAFGATCAENRVAGGLVVRGCASTTLCPAGAPETRCNADGDVIACHDGMVERTTCGFGERCTEGQGEYGEAAAACRPRVEGPCNDVGETACDGDRLRACVAHGGWAGVQVTDCAHAGLVCRKQGLKSACVVDRDATCTRHAPRCEGDLLVYCAAGLETKVSCEKIGLGPCDPGARGPSAACGPPITPEGAAP